MTSLLDDIASPAALSLPAWPLAPEPVDATGRSFVVVSFGDDARGVADAWSASAALTGPVTRIDGDRLDLDELGAALTAARCGARVMVAGPQDDVLLALAAAREAGAEPEELRSFVTRADVLPLYCAHCRGTHRVVAEPGGLAECPGCGRTLDVHPHVSAVRGSFLGSDAMARELA